MSAGKKILLYAAVFAAMLLGFWFFVFRGTDDWKSKLPVIAYIQPFSFINEKGDTVTQANTAGKIYVANYFFTTCKGICPNMNGHVKKLYNDYKGNQDLLILTHTCQPEVDSLPVLQQYADSIGADGEQWQFITGDKLELYRAARESYHIDDPKNNVGNINDQFLHSQFLALVDKKGQLRGVYDGLKDKEMAQLRLDIDGLMKESNHNGFANSIFGTAPTR
jgi:protein SCO1/2